MVPCTACGVPLLSILVSYHIMPWVFPQVVSRRGQWTTGARQVSEPIYSYIWRGVIFFGIMPHRSGAILSGCKKSVFRKSKIKIGLWLVGVSARQPWWFWYFGKSVFSQEVLGDFYFLFSGCLFYSKFHLSRDTRENTRASTHSSVPRKMSNPPPDQQIGLKPSWQRLW